MEPIILAHHGVRPRIADSAYVSPGVSLIGEVEIGADSSVWFGSVIRGDVHAVRIGARTSIQDNSTIHTTEGWLPTLVGDDVTVGHGVILHGCSIADRVLVGMGSIVLDDVEIESDVMIAAGSLLTSGTRAPSGWLMVGRPAKPRKRLTDAHLEALRSSAGHYVQKAREYRQGGG